MEVFKIAVNLMIFGTFYMRLYQQKCNEGSYSWLLPYVQQNVRAEESFLRR